jgi:hypothetical protein
LFYLGVHEGHNHFLVVAVAEDIKLGPHQDSCCIHTCSMFYLGVHESHNYFLVVAVAEVI